MKQVRGETKRKNCRSNFILHLQKRSKEISARVIYDRLPEPGSLFITLDPNNSFKKNCYRY